MYKREIRKIVRNAYLKKSGHTFDLTDSDSKEFLEYKFRKSPEYKKWKLNESKRNKEWEKEESIENIEKLSSLLTKVGQKHNLWTKQTGQGFLARIYLPGSQKAFLNDSGFLAEPYGTIYGSQVRKINKATVLFFKWQEEVQEIRDQKRDMEYLRAIGQWIKDNNHTILAGNVDSLKLAFNSYEKAWGGYSTHSLPTRNAEKMFVAEKKERDVPKYVTEKAHYFEEEEDYETSKAWALAWSIYCKYKEPNSDHCERNKRYYLMNQGQKDPKKMKPYPKKWQTPANTKG